MPVGRFVLDVARREPTLWPASDALCAALQVINHLQDCAPRLSPPRPRLFAVRHSRRAWRFRRDARQPTAPPFLRGAIADLARRTSELGERGAALVPRIADVRLSLEIAAIHGSRAHAWRATCKRRDPLSQRVHLGKARIRLGRRTRRPADSRSGVAPLASERGRESAEHDPSGRRPRRTVPSTWRCASCPKHQREAMFSVYRFCRAVDDIADERGLRPPAQRLAELERWRADIAAMFAGRTPPDLADLDRGSAPLWPAA